MNITIKTIILLILSIVFITAYIVSLTCLYFLVSTDEHINTKISVLTISIIYLVFYIYIAINI